ncbi:GPW/gp25 family protein [Celerinatantimonas sp. MCCC 1A17872]|uniref:GPW/gp25 family protein n=1 Tax=Celerinatantimonas sp. MCCC 1A17872 TaxID=3177514 RepID=UPI0038C96EFE
MMGMSADNGRTLTGDDHLVQSISDILNTPIGSRVMRRDYGSQLLDLIDSPANEATSVLVYSAIASALLKWEQRIRISQLSLSSTEQSGAFVVEITGTRTDTNAATNLRIPVRLGAAA